MRSVSSRRSLPTVQILGRIARSGFYQFKADKDFRQSAPVYGGKIIRGKYL
jgi:hypothetical protein